MALRRGPRWLIAWAAVIALLSVTRDSMWIPVLAAVCLAAIQRTRITVALAATGFAAALPAVIAIKVPLRELLAQMLNGLQPAPDASWGEIASRYPAAIVDCCRPTAASSATAPGTRPPICSPASACCSCSRAAAGSAPRRRS